MAARPAPPHHLDPRAKTLWRLNALMEFGVLLAFAVAATWGMNRLDIAWRWAAIPVVGALLIGAITVGPVPGLRWRQWRYEIGEQEVDLQHGLLTVTRTLIPMTRIQHVDTRRSPLQRRYGLASVILYTAAGAIEVPALADDIAGSVRDRIAELANTRDDLL